jgi:hypothetical protein
MAGLRSGRPIDVPTSVRCGAAAPPRAEQRQQPFHTLARGPRLQGATMTRMEIERVAGLPTTGSDGSLARHDWVLLLIERLAREPSLLERGKCMGFG